MINSISSASVWTNSIPDSKKSKGSDRLKAPVDKILIPADKICIAGCNDINYWPGVVFDGMSNTSDKSTFVSIDLSAGATDEYYFQVKHWSNTENINYEITLNLKDCKISHKDNISNNLTVYDKITQGTSTVAEMEAYIGQLKLIEKGLNDAFGGFMQYAEYADFIKCEKQKINQLIEDAILNTEMNSFFSGCGDLESYAPVTNICSAPGGSVYDTFSLVKNSSQQNEIYTKEDVRPGTGPGSVNEFAVNLSTGELAHTLNGAQTVLPNPNTGTQSEAELYKQKLASMINIISSIQQGGAGCNPTPGPNLGKYANFLTCAKSKNVNSVEDINKDLINGVKVFPNPASSTLNVLLPKAAGQDVNVKIFNIIGQEVKSLTIPKGEKAIKWDVKEDGISSGMYIYQISLNGAVAKGKAQIINR